MPSITVNLSWVDTNRVEDGYKVYRSTSPMSTGTMPAPLATLTPDSETYVDTDVVYGNTYYYIVSAYNTLQATEIFSENKEVVCQENIYAISPSGEFHKLDTNGNKLFVDKTSNLFGTVDVNSCMDIDYKGNFYFKSGNKLKKFDKTFNQVWEYTLDTSSSAYIAFYVGIDEKVYVVNCLNKIDVFSIDKNGLRENTYYSSTHNSRRYPSICLSPDNMELYFSFGYGSSDYLYIINKNSNKNFYKSIGGYYFTNRYSLQRSLVVDKNHNVYGGGDDFISSYDRYGNERWNVYRYIGNRDYQNVVMSNDESSLFYLGGDTNNRTYLKKFSTSTGTEIVGTNNSYMNDICIDSNDNIYVCTGYNTIDGKIVKYNSSLQFQWTINTLSDAFEYILIEPGMHYQSLHKNLGGQ